jgi:hypothetical protein
LESDGRDSCPFSAIFIQRMPNEHVLSRSRIDLVVLI